MASQKNLKKSHAKLTCRWFACRGNFRVHLCTFDCVLYPVWSSTVVRREEKAVIPEHSAARRIKAVTSQHISISLASKASARKPACLCVRARSAPCIRRHRIVSHPSYHTSTVMGVSSPTPTLNNFPNARARAADGTLGAGVCGGGMIDSSSTR